MIYYPCCCCRCRTGIRSPHSNEDLRQAKRTQNIEMLHSDVLTFDILAKWH